MAHRQANGGRQAGNRTPCHQRPHDHPRRRVLLLSEHSVSKEPDRTAKTQITSTFRPCSHAEHIGDPLRVGAQGAEAENTLPPAAAQRLTKVRRHRQALQAVRQRFSVAAGNHDAADTILNEFAGAAGVRDHHRPFECHGFDHAGAQRLAVGAQVPETSAADSICRMSSWNPSQATLACKLRMRMRLLMSRRRAGSPYEPTKTTRSCGMFCEPAPRLLPLSRGVYIVWVGRLEARQRHRPVGRNVRASLIFQENLPESARCRFRRRLHRRDPPGYPTPRAGAPQTGRQR